MKIHLPVDDYISKIKQALKENSSVIVTAAPGAGKTTRIPPALMDLSAKKVLVLEPRRIAAIADAAVPPGRAGPIRHGEPGGFAIPASRR